MDGKRQALVVLRCLQIGAALPTIICMAVQVVALTSAASYLRTHKVSWGVNADDQAMTAMAHDAVVELLAVCSAILAMACITFALICTWLAFTLNDQKRPRRAGCSSYTCDMSWDILFAAFWLAMLVVAAVNRTITGSILSACLAVLFISSAVVAGKVRGDFRRNGGEAAAAESRAVQWQTPIMGSAV